MESHTLFKLSSRVRLQSLLLTATAVSEQRLNKETAVQVEIFTVSGMFGLCSAVCWVTHVWMSAECFRVVLWLFIHVCLVVFLQLKVSLWKQKKIQCISSLSVTSLRNERSIPLLGLLVPLFQKMCTKTISSGNQHFLMLVATPAARCSFCSLGPQAIMSNLSPHTQEAWFRWDWIRIHVLFTRSCYNSDLVWAFN